MRKLSNSPKTLLLLAMLSAPAGIAHAQQVPGEAEPSITVTGAAPADLTGLPPGPEVEGIISARNEGAVQVTTAGGSREMVLISDGTKVRSSGGLLGLNRNRLASNSLLNGLPVSIRTVQWSGGLVATQVDLKSRDLRTASMIHNGTDQRFGEQAAATEALRGRMGDIDQYNVKNTVDVNFDTGKAVLSEQGKADLCGVASQAEGVDNALLLVVGLPPGPEVEGIISARNEGAVQVTTAGGSREMVLISDGTKVRSSGGLLGLNRNRLASNSLLNGLPVSIRTVQWSGGLVATQVDLKSRDLRTASMIHNGTDQRFGEQAAATEALRGRMGDIDQYNVKNTVDVNFDTGKAVLSEQGKADLCGVASQAEGVDNALLLVVGYTDSTGSEEVNQELSEKRAGRVVNYLQQACGWKPYRMLTPTGMAAADPAASNDTEEGKARNRRVSVNVLVSKGLDGL